MFKRNIRLRREYLYRKSLEGKERALYEKKRKIRQALEGYISEHTHTHTWKFSWFSF
jgi:hypothetical protein